MAQRTKVTGFPEMLYLAGVELDRAPHDKIPTSIDVSDEYSLDMGDVHTTVRDISGDVIVGVYKLIAVKITKSPEAPATMLVDLP